MSRTFLIYLALVHLSSSEGVVIEHPSNRDVEERIRKDLDAIDPILRHYIVPREIQFDAKAIKTGLPYFLRCKGSHPSVNFTVPTTALKYLTLTTDNTSHTITASLQKNSLNTNLVGRYTCSETINEKYHETTVHVFIQDGLSVFTKKLYPTIYKQTGIHFFNLPCHTANWHAKVICPSTNQNRCKLRSCTLRERQINELKCNMPTCDGQDRCIPVYFTPQNVTSEKVLFDPQIGFGLINPIIPNALTEFNCMSNYTPSREYKIPLDSSLPDYVQIEQSSLTVMQDETVRLTCEIQYGTKVNRKLPTLYWFDDIYGLNLILNETSKPVFNFQTQVYRRNSSITVRGFKPNNIYRFYCVRVSDRGLYSRSVDITCASASSMDLEVDSSETSADKKITYGSNAVYDITILTIPRSSIVLELSRNGLSLANDKRFEILLINNQENQFLEYTLTIYNITFEDETDFKITARSSMLERSKMFKPNIIGDPVGQLSFVSEQVPDSIPWRAETPINKFNIFPYGIFEQEAYKVVCTVRHRADIKQPLKVSIQYSSCVINECLSDLISKPCRTSSNQPRMDSTSNRINQYQTQVISNTTHMLSSASIGYQYLCCYEDSGVNSIAKAITVLSHARDMFHVSRPNFGLVIGDSLTYRCEAHELLYSDVKMIYYDGLWTYERNHYDAEWHLKGTNQVKPIDISFTPAINSRIRSTQIEVKTPSLGVNDNNKYFECIARSTESSTIPHVNDTYVIKVEDPIALTFRTSLPSISRFDQKTGDNVLFDCKFDGKPKPRVVWFKGKSPLNAYDSMLQLGESNESISIIRVQASDTGFYTCELNNGHHLPLRRSFDLRVQGTNPHPKIGRFIGVFIFVFIVIFLVLLFILIFLTYKYCQMKRIVNASIFHERKSAEPEDQSQSAMNQLAGIRLPDNFASMNQIRTFLSYVNGDHLPLAKDDFKELGHGQFGVVYQVRLPDVGLVAAKTLPESIRQLKDRRHRRKKSHDFEENEDMITEQENQKKKAAEMLIDEIKVMHKAGKHVNIVALRKVAYPEARFRFLFTGGPIRDEDSFYLMELCSNGSLESILKQFLAQSSTSQSRNTLSLYETLSKQAQPGMTMQEALKQCVLTDDDLKLMAYQVACGVDYLNRQQIVHCDIAARNVLVTSKFIMKICDFGLATWTSYKNYREQLEHYESVQIGKKSNEIATHNLTPELAKAFLNASDPDERLLLNKSSMKSDVWSFGIFIWTLFTKCRFRPFYNLLEEIQNKSSGQQFFHQLAVVISEGRVLQYIDYHPEIPRNVYAIIRECLVDENHRPEMIRIRALLCHSKVLSKQAFEYYKLEYNQYQEENATDDNVERFGDVQGVSDLPSFDDHTKTARNNTTENIRSPSDVIFRPKTTEFTQQARDSYLTPIGLDSTSSGFEKKETKSNSSEFPTQGLGPTRPAPPPPPTTTLSTKPTRPDDGYL